MKKRACCCNLDSGSQEQGKISINLLEESSRESEHFKYWSIFLDELYSLLCDLTVSHRNGDRLLRLSVVKRAIRVFFAFDRSNYSHWAPLFLQDCLNLEQMFPLIYEKGSFVVRHTHRKCTTVPVDQPLEK